MSHSKSSQLIIVSIEQQTMTCFDKGKQWLQFQVSTGKNGAGELMDSGRTPRGWHKIATKIGAEYPVNAVLVSRKWTEEIYTDELAQKNPGRDWILTRIMQLEGLEPGRNLGGNVDTMARYIYIHGTPDTTPLGKPGSKGCIRMRNHELQSFYDWVAIGAFVCIE